MSSRLQVRDGAQPGQRRAHLVGGVADRRVQHGVAGRVAQLEVLRQRRDELLRADAGGDLGRRVDGGAEPARDPAARRPRASALRADRRRVAARGVAGSDSAARTASGVGSQGVPIDRSTAPPSCSAARAMISSSRSYGYGGGTNLRIAHRSLRLFARALIAAWSPVEHFQRVRSRFEVVGEQLGQVDAVRAGRVGRAGCGRRTRRPAAPRPAARGAPPAAGRSRPPRPTRRSDRARRRSCRPGRSSRRPRRPSAPAAAAARRRPPSPCTACWWQCGWATARHAGQRGRRPARRLGRAARPASGSAARPPARRAGRRAAARGRRGAARRCTTAPARRSGCRPCGRVDQRVEGAAQPAAGAVELAGGDPGQPAADRLVGDLHVVAGVLEHPHRGLADLGAEVVGEGVDPQHDRACRWRPGALGVNQRAERLRREPRQRAARVDAARPLGQAAPARRCAAAALASRGARLASRAQRGSQPSA